MYNFFEDSAIDATRWRVLLNHAEGEVDGEDLAKVHAPSFARDEGRFAGICSEVLEIQDIRRPSLTLLIVEIVVRWHHSSKEDFVHLRQVRQGRAYAGK